MSRHITIQMVDEVAKTVVLSTKEELLFTLIPLILSFVLIMILIYVYQNMKDEE